MLVAVDTGESVVLRARDGSVEFDALELVGQPICVQLHEPIAQRLPAAPRMPRIPIDDLTIARAAWSVSPGDLPWLHDVDRGARFVAARRWARALGLPRHVFYKVPTERKPCYLDFDPRDGCRWASDQEGTEPDRFSESLLYWGLHRRSNQMVT